MVCVGVSVFALPGSSCECIDRGGKLAFSLVSFRTAALINIGGVSFLTQT